MDYEFVYYCLNCDRPVHISRILKGYTCRCGCGAFGSHTEFDLRKYFEELEED